MAKKQVQSVYRLATESFRRGDSTYVQSKVLRLQKRKSDWDLMDEEFSAVGDEAFDSIINLYSVDDGLYYLIPCNISYDIEGGWPDGHDLKLVPYGDK